MPGAQARDDQPLLGFGRRRLFDDVFDFVQVRLPGDAPAADGAVVGQHVFAGRLHAGDGAVLGFGDADELPVRSARRARG